MKIKNKKGVELALNMIILVTLGIVILVIAIVLIRKTGKVVGDEIPRIVGIMDALWKPTAENPIIISPSTFTMRPGENKVLTLQVYNYMSNEIMCNLGFSRVGSDNSNVLKFTYFASNRNIPVSMVGEWKINLNVPKETSPDVYMYISSINCGEFSKQADIFVTVS